MAILRFYLQQELFPACQTPSGGLHPRDTRWYNEHNSTTTKTNQGMKIACVRAAFQWQFVFVFLQNESSVSWISSTIAISRC